jgi:hypothetical protein
MMDRRAFLKISGLSAVAVTAGSVAYRVGGVWWDQTAAAHLKVLSADEARIVAAMADAMFPDDGWGMPNGIEAGVIEALDDYLAAIDRETANLLRLLIHAIDDMSVMRNLGMTRFHKRSREERVAILRAWDTSSISVRRGAFQGLKFVMCMGYCEHPAVLKAAKIDYSCGELT